MRAVEERAVSSGVGNINRSALRKRNVRRKREKIRLFAERLLGIRAGLAPGEIDPVARHEPLGILSNRFNCARSIGSWRVWELWFLRICTSSHVDVHRVYTRRADIHDHLLRPGLQIRNLFEPHDRRSTEFMHADCFHFFSPADWM